MPKTMTVVREKSGEEYLTLEDFNLADYDADGAIILKTIVLPEDLSGLTSSQIRTSQAFDCLCSFCSAINSNELTEFIEAVLTHIWNVARDTKKKED